MYQGIYRVTFSECPAQRSCSAVARHLARPYEYLDTSGRNPAIYSIFSPQFITRQTKSISYSIHGVFSLSQNGSNFIHRRCTFAIPRSQYPSLRRNRKRLTTGWLRRPHDSDRRISILSTVVATALRKRAEYESSQARGTQCLSIYSRRCSVS